MTQKNRSGKYTFYFFFLTVLVTTTTKETKNTSKYNKTKLKEIFNIQ